MSVGSQLSLQMLVCRKTHTGGGETSFSARSDDMERLQQKNHQAQGSKLQGKQVSPGWK